MRRRRRRRLGEDIRMPRGWERERSVGRSVHTRFQLFCLDGSGGGGVENNDFCLQREEKYIGVYNLVTHADQTSLITNYEYKYVKSVFALSLIPRLSFIRRIIKSGIFSSLQRDVASLSLRGPFASFLWKKKKKKCARRKAKVVIFIA
jgi:hypothetical protein